MKNQVKAGSEPHRRVLDNVGHREINKSRSKRVIKAKTGEAIRPNRRYLKTISKVGICLAISVLCVQSGSFLAAQVGNQEKLRYEVTVALKLVQVYVLDKHGNAVADLTKSDFELYDNGRTKPITDFEKHELSLDRVPQVPQPPVPAASVSSTNRKFFLFFDFAFNNIAGISKSRTAALNFLDTQVRTDDEVGVVSFSARQGLTLHEYLTSDHRRIRQVVERLGPGKFLGRAWGLDSEWVKDHRKVDQAIGSDMTARIFEAEQKTLKKEAIGFASQISELAKALRKIPGIKNIILFSSGIPNYALYGGRYIIDETGSRWGDAALRDFYNEMCKELASSNSAVYAVNVSSAGSAPFEERDLMGDGALRQLAKDSGGKYFDNINSYENINRTIQKVTGTYYVLGYYIDEKRDGRFHNVRVKVKRKGCAVFGQKGYFNPKPFSEYSENEKLLHIIDLTLAENPMLQVPAEVPLTALPIIDGGKPAIIAILSIPRRLAASALANRAEALCLIFDENGDTESIVPLRITNPDLEKEFFQLVFTVPTRPGRVVCRIALCNMETGYGVRGLQTLTVPEAREAALWLDPPLFLTDRRVEDIYASPGTSLENLYAYDPQEYSPLLGDLPAGTKMFRAALRVTSIRPNPEIELTAQLMETGGAASRSVPIAILREFTDGPTKKLLIDLASGELKPGHYTLSLIAKEKGGQAVAQTAAMITVK
jgi:VWFA-related protein